MYIYIYKYTYINIYTYIHKPLYIYMHEPFQCIITFHICINLFHVLIFAVPALLATTNIYIYIHIYICLYLCTYTCVYIYIYVHT